MVKRPIDSFVKYFLDVKPYHTKILEIVERYLIDEDVNVSIKENIFFTEEWSNTPLCKGVGYGLDFDDDCGFSSLSCCDLFDCIGGFGLIFDNSDLLVTAPMSSYDAVAGTITLQGDHRYDTYHQINAITSNSIRIRGNHVSSIAPHALFVIAPKSTYLVQETVFNGFYVAGNVRRQFTAANEFSLIHSTSNDDTYSVVEATYLPDTRRTFIRVNREDLDANALGSILVDSGTKNNGAYQRDSVSFDGTYTVIHLHPDSPRIALPNETRHGSIVLRTGFVAGRRVWLNNVPDVDVYSPTSSEAKIVDCSYNELDATTTITIDVAHSTTRIEPTLISVAQLDFDNITSAQLRGYYFGAGYDGFEECSTPKPYHIYANISEFLSIEEIIYTPVTPDLYFALLTENYTPPPLPPQGGGF